MNDLMTAREAEKLARIDVQRAARESGGTTCPVCDHHVQVYRRKFNARMARTLILIAPWFRREEVDGLKYLHVTQYCVTKFSFVPGDHGKLAWWGLLEPCPDEPENGSNHHGLWRMTQAGHQFVERTATIMSHAVVYKGDVLGLEGDWINIHQALGKAFDYDELMSAAA